MKRIKGFKRRLFRSYMIIGMVPLIFTMIGCYYVAYEMVSKKINSSINNNMGIVAELLDSTISNLESITDYIGEHKEIKDILMKDSYENYDERFDDVQVVYKIINSFFSTIKFPFSDHSNNFKIPLISSSEALSHGIAFHFLDLYVMV